MRLPPHLSTLSNKKISDPQVSTMQQGSWLSQDREHHCSRTSYYSDSPFPQGLARYIKYLHAYLH